MKDKNVKVQKTKNKKKKFNWSKVLYWLKGLVDNGVCKELGTKYWIISIPIMLLSLFISVMPTLTTEATKNGSTAINVKTNDILIESLYDYVNDESTLDFEVKDHKLVALSSVSTKDFYTFTRDEHRLDMYYFDTSEGNLTFTEQYNSAKTTNTNLESGIFFGTEFYSIQLYNKASTSSSILASTSGGYTNIEDIPSLKTYIKNGVSTSESIENVKKAYFKNFATLVDKGYLDVRPQQVGLNVGMLLAVNGGITIIMIPILFLMTRGKNNPSREMKFYQVMGVGFMASASPAILALVVGYIMGGSFQTLAMIYVMIYGFRCMWLSMKYLRPQYQ